MVDREYVIYDERAIYDPLIAKVIDVTNSLEDAKRIASGIYAPTVIFSYDQNEHGYRTDERLEEVFR